MLRTSSILTIAALLGALAACTGSGSSTPKTDDASGKIRPAPPAADVVGTKLADVNGLPVGTRIFESLSQRRPPADGAAFSAEEKAEILDDAVTEEILFQSAFARGLYQDPKVRKIMVNLLLRDEVYGSVDNSDFSEEEQQAYFAEHKHEFVVPAKVHIKRIFVAITPERDEAAALARANEVRTKIVANPDAFRDLAAEYSDGPFKRRGGDLGFVSGPDGKPGVPPEVISRSFELDADAISEPFVAGAGYNIVYVPTKRERIDRTFDQMRGSVLRRLKNERYEQLTSDFIEKVKADMTIKVDEAALGAYAPPVVTRPGNALPGLPDPEDQPEQFRHDPEDDEEGGLGAQDDGAE